MKKFKKLVATALVAVMVLTTMALSASAGTGSKIEELRPKADRVT